MVSPIRPGTPPLVKPAATGTPAAKPDAGNTPSGTVTGRGGGSGNISVDEQRRIIKAADEKGSGTKGDGLASREDIRNYFSSQAPQQGDASELKRINAEINAKTDAFMKALDKAHGDAKGGDNLVDDGDVTNNNAVIEYSFTYSNTPAGGEA